MPRSADAASLCSPSVYPRTRKILIVDDNAALRRVVRSIIENEDELQVCGEAIDGIDAVAKAEALKPDLIILDLVMPE